MKRISFDSGHNFEHSLFSWGITVDRTIAFSRPEIEEGTLVLDLKATTAVGKLKKVKE